ncbi:hypothetical protein [Coxiella-like endosymbiont]|uniref:hypothetical protein n=1 Tax=Coxiella-like endosymbiont TaxID=1592897 RepID=UPI00272AB6D4|nr:hypothetical protein [Coxiella-like endosymbiont]
MAGVGVTPAIAFTRKLITSQSERRLHIDYSVLQLINLILWEELKKWPKHYDQILVAVRITRQQGHILANQMFKD